MDTYFLRMMLFFIYPAWLSLSTLFINSLLSPLSTKSTVTLDPTLAMSHHAVPLISTRWWCIYDRCSFVNDVTACLDVLDQVDYVLPLKAGKLLDMDLHGPH